MPGGVDARPGTCHEVHGQTTTVLERGLGTDPFDPAKVLVDDRLPPTR